MRITLTKLPAISCAFLLVAVTGCSAVINQALQPIKVQGTAMIPTIKDGDRVFTTRDVANLERGDIVLFYSPDDPEFSFIKRIVGLPNEQVEIKERAVFINGKKIDEPYVDAENNLSRVDQPPVTVPADAYFILGDNRDNSADSRIFGPIPKKLFYGKYLRTYYSS